MRYRRVAPAVALVLSFGLVPGNAAAAPAAATLITGTVVADGAPVADAVVTVDLWPVVDVTAERGEAVDVLRVGGTTTDAAGAFRVDLDPRLVPDTHVSSDGIVNYQVQAATKTALVDWNSSARIAPAVRSAGVGAWRGLADPGRVHALASVSLDLAGRTASRADRAARTRTPASEAAVRRLDGVPALAEIAPPGCAWVHWDTPPDGYETFTKVFAEGLVASGRVIQSVGSNHTLGVGFSTSGTHGSFVANGTATRDSQWGYDTSWTLNDKRVRNQFRYHRYKRVCPGGAHQAFELRPVKAIAGPFIDNETPPTWCRGAVIYRDGWTFWRRTGQQRSYETGMQVFGVGLYAQSGWGSNQELGFKFHRDGLMCANNTDGIGNAPQVRAESGV